MQVRYVGPFEAVIVPEVSLAGAVRRDEPLEVDAALAERLLAQQGTWEAVPAEKPAKGKE